MYQSVEETSKNNPPGYIIITQVKASLAFLLNETTVVEKRHEYNLSSYTLSFTVTYFSRLMNMNRCGQDYLLILF